MHDQAQQSSNHAAALAELFLGKSPFHLRSSLTSQRYRLNSVTIMRLIESEGPVGMLYHMCPRLGEVAALPLRPVVETIHAADCVEKLL